MPLTRKQKEERVSAIQTDIQAATSAVFMSYDKLTVGEAEELRSNLFDVGSRMRVLPKRLLARVTEQLKIEFDPREHEGQIAVIWGNDTVAPAKTLHEFIQKDHKHVQILAGVLDGATLSADRVQVLAKLPSREQLLGQLVSVLAGPSRNFVSVLAGPSRALVYALQAIADRKGKA
jgi:large subunit ribosomal protein L10